jgi:hypothetical protein
MNTQDCFIKWDLTPVNAVITSCFGQKVPSKGSGIARIGFKVNDRILHEDVHAIFVPELPQSLIGATYLMNHHNISTHIARGNSHIVLSSGACVPLQTDDDMLVCDCVVLGGNKSIHAFNAASESIKLKSAQTDDQHEKPSKSEVQIFSVASTSKAGGNESLFKLWTRKLCGLNPSACAKVADNTVGANCPTIIPDSCKTLRWYGSALAGKMNAMSHSLRQTRAMKFRDVVSFDFLEFKVHGRKFHSLNFLDHKTTHGRCMVTTSRADALKLVKKYVNETERFVTGCTTMECQSDCAKEFMSKALENYCDASNIIQVHSAPYQHQSMGSVERFNQTIQRMVTTIMDDSGVPIEYVPYAIQYAEYVYNRVPVQHLLWKTRYELVTGRKPDLRSLYSFGCKCKVLMPLQHRIHKFHTRTWDCVNLGWNSYSHGWSVLHNGKVFVSPDVIFYENERPFRSVGGKVHGFLKAEDNDYEDSKSFNVVTALGTEADICADNQTELEGDTSDGQPQSPQTPDNIIPPGWVARRHEGNQITRPYVTYHGPHGEHAESISAVHRLIRNAGRPTPGQAYEPFDQNAPIRQSSRLQGVTLPPINVLTGDAAPTHRVETENGEVFVPEGDDESDHEEQIDIDALHVSMSGMGGNVIRTRWIQAFAAFTALMSPEHRGIPIASDSEKYVKQAGSYFSCVDAFSVSFNTFDMTLPEPVDLQTAMSSPNWNVENGYKAATLTELGRWKSMEVYAPISSVPDRIKSLGIRLLYSVKTDELGKFSKAKCRVVILGHRAELGEHYIENCATTMKWPSLRCVASVALCRKAHVFKQWDTSTAFLYADLEPGTECFVRVPSELGDFIGEASPYWKILKSAYGLPSAPREFQRHVGRTLRKCKMVPSKVDPNIFVRTRGDEFLYICTWVDDFAIFSNSTPLYEEVKKMYFETYQCSEEDLRYLLGVHIEISTDHNSIKIHSRKQIEKILAKFGTPSRGSLVPATSEFADLANIPLPEVGSEEYLLLRERALRYRSLVPSILYVATTTRPDITYAVGMLCRALDNPSEKHLQGAETLLSYLAGTSTVGVTWNSTNTFELSARYSPLKNGLVSLSDSDWSTGKSISGFVLFMGGGPIVWASKRQPVTSLSSTEAEYYAASTCGTEVLYVRYLLHDLGVPETTPTTMLIDNSACVSLGKNFGTCKRAKHIDRRINFLNDYVDMGEIKLQYVPTKDNIADIFTKPLDKVRFSLLRSSLVS